MSKSVQIRRGSHESHLSFTGLEGEVTADMTKKTLVVHDGQSAGGHPLAREDLSNVQAARIIEKGVAKADMDNVSAADIAARGIALSDLTNVSADTIASHGIMKADSSNAAHLANEGHVGPTQFATLDESMAETESAKAVSPKNVGAIARKYLNLIGTIISGLNTEVVSEHSIRVTCGKCRNSDDTGEIRNEGDLTKLLDAPWEKGTNLGAKPDGIAIGIPAKYFIFVIAGEDGAADIAIDTDADAAHILADPDITAAGYGKYRAIGLFYTDSAGGIKSMLSYSQSPELADKWQSDDGKSWYRKYKDGWIEQGGISMNVNGGVHINLPVAMSSNNYMAIGTVQCGTTNAHAIIYDNKSPTAIHLNALTSGGSWTGALINWEIKGY
jgi:hypothetical protein